MSIVMCLLVSLLPGQSGVTTEVERFYCARVEPADETRAEWQKRAVPVTEGPSEGDESCGLSWALVDSLAVSGELAPAKRVVVSASDTQDSLELLFPLDTLALVCQQALNLAPTWIREEMASALRRLGDSAEFYAQMLLGAPEDWTDELAFCVAKIGPEVLTHRFFNPSLLLENCRYLYELDDSLDYADIVERGTRPGDYYSTVRYAVLLGTDTVYRELPRDIYYHYVVHPTTSDELPRMDDYVCGKHWREYLFYDADSGYPVLAEHIRPAKVVWKSTKQVLAAGRPFEPTDCALDVIGNWATRTVPAGASGNRPIHPAVIAHEHNGNCGELQDLLAAAGRTCLIPVVNTMDPCEDHVWCEFWDQDWYPYQVDLGFGATHIADTSVAYDEQVGGSKRVSSIWNWRPDGYWWTVTGRYSNTCSLYVRVLDQLGRPIDGARVIIISEGWVGGLATTTIGFTDNLGAVGFELGDLRNFYARVSTPLAEYPGPDSSVQIISVSQSGAVYFKTFYMPVALPAPRPRFEPFRGDSAVVCKFEADLGITAELDLGYCVSRAAGSGDPNDTVRVYQFYADKHEGGLVDAFLTDTAGYRRYLAGERFGVLWFGDNTRPRSIELVCPTGDRYYLAFSSEDRTYSSRWLDLSVRLYVWTPAVAEPGQLAGKVASCASVCRRLRFGPGTRAGPTRFRVFDVAGGLVAELQTDGPGLVQEVELQSGVYLVRTDEAGNTSVQKVVVLR